MLWILWMVSHLSYCPRMTPTLASTSRTKKFNFISEIHEINWKTVAIRVAKSLTLDFYLTCKHFLISGIHHKAIKISAITWQTKIRVVVWTRRANFDISLVLLSRTEVYEQRKLPKRSELLKLFSSQSWLILMKITFYSDFWVSCASSELDESVSFSAETELEQLLSQQECRFPLSLQFLSQQRRIWNVVVRVQIGFQRFHLSLPIILEQPLVQQCSLCKVKHSSFYEFA